MSPAQIRTVSLRVAALALLLLLVLVATITVRTVGRLPDAAIYLVRSDEATFTLERVTRRLDARGPEALAGAAVAALAEGPTAAEAEAGLSSEVPADTRVREAELDDGRLRVDLHHAFAEGGGSASMRGRLQQVQWTLTQPAGVEEVVLELDGRPLTVLGGEGVMVARPWRRPPDGTLPRW